MMRGDACGMRLTGKKFTLSLLFNNFSEQQFLMCLRCELKLLPTSFEAGGIQAEEDEEEDGESPEGRTAIAEEGQWDADNGH